MYRSDPGGGVPPPSYCCVGRQVHPPQPGFAWCCCGLGGGNPPQPSRKPGAAGGGAPPLGPHPSAAVATADQTPPDGLGQFPRFCRPNALPSAFLLWSPPHSPIFLKSLAKKQWSVLWIDCRFLLISVQQGLKNNFLALHSFRRPIPLGASEFSQGSKRGNT
jgi:hypothetical protein